VNQHVTKTSSLNHVFKIGPGILWPKAGLQHIRFIASCRCSDQSRINHTFWW